MTEDIRFFLPGPSYVLEKVRLSMAQYPIGHRGAEFKAINSRLAAGLPQVFRTSRPVMIVTGSGSIMWDMATLALVNTSVLNLVNGSFSDRFHSVCKAWGKEADKVEVPLGKIVEPDLLRQALRRKKYELVTFAHNETSTGVLNPLAELVAVVREESDALVAVDCVSSLAGARVESEEWDADFLFTASQKALALPPGLALCTLSERAVAKIAKAARAATTRTSTATTPSRPPSRRSPPRRSRNIGRSTSSSRSSSKKAWRPAGSAISICGRTPRRGPPRAASNTPRSGRRLADRQLPRGRPPGSTPGRWSRSCAPRAS